MLPEFSFPTVRYGMCLLLHFNGSSATCPDGCPSPCKSIRPTALLVVSRVVRTTCANKLLLLTAKVCLLKLCNLLIIDRERSTAVALFTHEVELCRRLMTAET